MVSQELGGVTYARANGSLNLTLDFRGWFDSDYSVNSITIGNNFDVLFENSEVGKPSVALAAVIVSLFTAAGMFEFGFQLFLRFYSISLGAL